MWTAPARKGAGAVRTSLRGGHRIEARVPTQHAEIGFVSVAACCGDGEPSVAACSGDGEPSVAPITGARGPGAPVPRAQ